MYICRGIEHAYSSGLGVDCLGNIASWVDCLRHVEGIRIMVENKKVVVASIICVSLAALFFGFTLRRNSYLEGYTKGLEDGAGHGYTIRDPTYQEATQFIATDQTDKNIYDETDYTCTNFAADFKNNAFDVGYRCGLVEIESPSLGHAIVCFYTIDRGLIFIEPQWDDIVTLTIGLSYSELNGYEIADYDDTVVRYVIIW